MHTHSHNGGSRTMVTVSKNKVENAIIRIMAFLIQGVITLGVLLMIASCVEKHTTFGPFVEHYNAEGEPCPITYWPSSCSK